MQSETQNWMQADSGQLSTALYRMGGKIDDWMIAKIHDHGMNAKLKLSSLFVIQNRNSRINRATRLLLSSLRGGSGMSGKGWPHYQSPTLN